VWDVKQECDSTGNKLSLTEIGSQVLPEVFQKIEKPLDYNNRQLKKFRQHIRELYTCAQRLIDNG